MSVKDSIGKMCICIKQALGRSRTDIYAALADKASPQQHEQYFITFMTDILCIAVVCWAQPDPILELEGKCNCPEWVRT